MKFRRRVQALQPPTESSVDSFNSANAQLVLFFFYWLLKKWYCFVSGTIQYLCPNSHTPPTLSFVFPCAVYIIPDHLFFSLPFFHSPKGATYFSPSPCFRHGQSLITTCVDLTVSHSHSHSHTHTHMIYVFIFFGCRSPKKITQRVGKEKCACIALHTNDYDTN